MIWTQQVLKEFMLTPIRRLIHWANENFCERIFFGMNQHHVYVSNVDWPNQGKRNCVSLLGAPVQSRMLKIFKFSKTKKIGKIQDEQQQQQKQKQKQQQLHYRIRIILTRIYQR